MFRVLNIFSFQLSPKAPCVLMKTVCCGCSKILPDIIFVNNERDDTNPRPQLRVKHNFIGDFIENALLLYLGVLPHHTLEPKHFTHQTVSLLYTIGPSGNAGTGFVFAALAGLCCCYQCFSDFIIFSQRPRQGDHCFLIFAASRQEAG